VNRRLARVREQPKLVDLDDRIGEIDRDHGSSRMRHFSDDVIRSNGDGTEFEVSPCVRPS
jgi:hypothetical protein